VCVCAFTCNTVCLRVHVCMYEMCVCVCSTLLCAHVCACVYVRVYAPVCVCVNGLSQRMLQAAVRSLQNGINTIGTMKRMRVREGHVCHDLTLFEF